MLLAFVVASTAGCYVGNLHIEGFYAPWENQSFTYPSNLASHLWILIDIDHIHISKGELEVGMLVVKIGGPAYWIGMGGGAASSTVSGQNDTELDFNAVQRGDAEMAQKLYHVVCACVEMGENNLIISIYDQGAGGKCNAVKEIIHLKEVEINIRAIVVDSLAREHFRSSGHPEPLPAVDLELDKVLKDMPQKCSEFNWMVSTRKPLDIALGTRLMDSLKKGLVAQQKTVGPFQSTLSDVAVIAQTYNTLSGGACAIGKQPIKGLPNPKAMARLSVGEALTNLIRAKVTFLSVVKASGNWMYAAKVDGEGAIMYDAAIGLSKATIELGIAMDGGKKVSSLSPLK
ncbi:hypothetical protein NE237_006507 [Protea cynaroides]|uniref:Uncharacterized protein n=1 Tax=Protea cynaroides TaxID=273540 RepID=A0A9Q0QVD7_9MAGN|nr:hypothetical protein NE237_006507 [Protea cynaroides]